MPVLLPLPRERETGTDRKFKRPFRSAGRPSAVLPAGGPAVPAALAARLWLVPAGWGMVQSQVFPRAREGASKRSIRVVRGGAFWGDPQSVRCAFRSGLVARGFAGFVGFRVALAGPP